MSDPDPHSGGFSLELGDDLVQMRDWLHEFAALDDDPELKALSDPREFLEGESLQ